MRDQQAEIATIKPRTFTLQLSDADTQRIYEKAYRDGITPAAVLEGFIGDLCSGTYTHGSDERMYANMYYDRCCYDIGIDISFLSWAIQEYYLEEIKDLLEQREYAAGDIAYLEEHPDEADPEEIPQLKAVLQDAENDLQAAYTAYKENGGQQAYKEGIEAIQAYLEELENMITGGRHDGKKEL